MGWRLTRRIGEGLPVGTSGFTRLDWLLRVACGLYVVWGRMKLNNGLMGHYAKKQRTTPQSCTARAVHAVSHHFPYKPNTALYKAAQSQGKYSQTETFRMRQSTRNCGRKPANL